MNECMIQERNKIIPNEEYMIWVEDQVRNVKRLSVKCLGERERDGFLSREIRENERKSHQNIYIEKS